jgi:hypothetical protein
MEAVSMFGNGQGPLTTHDLQTRAYLAGRRLQGASRLTRKQQLRALSGALAFFVILLILFFTVG